MGTITFRIFASTLAFFLVRAFGLQAQDFIPFSQMPAGIGEVKDMDYDSSTNRIFVLGNFDNVEGMAIERLTYVQDNKWHGMGIDAQSSIRDITVLDKGKLFAIGDSIIINNKNIGKAAIWQNNSWQPFKANTTYFEYLYCASYADKKLIYAGITKTDKFSQGELCIYDLELDSIVFKKVLLGRIENIVQTSNQIWIAGVTSFSNNLFYQYHQINDTTIVGKILFDINLEVFLNPNGILYNNSFYAIPSVPEPQNLLKFNENGSYEIIKDLSFNPFLLSFLPAKNELLISDVREDYPTPYQRIYKIMPDTSLQLIADLKIKFAEYNNLKTRALAIGDSLWIGGPFDRINDEFKPNIVTLKNGTIQHKCKMNYITNHSSENTSAVENIFEDHGQKRIWAVGKFIYVDSLLSPNIAIWNGKDWTNGNPTFKISNEQIAKILTYDAQTYIFYSRPTGNQTNGYFRKWDGMDWGTETTLCNNRISDAIVYNNELYIGGNFTEVDGKQIVSIAKYSNNTWQTVPLKYHTEGAFSTFKYFQDKLCFSMTNALYFLGKDVEITHVNSALFVAKTSGDSNLLIRFADSLIRINDINLKSYEVVGLSTSSATSSWLYNTFEKVTYFSSGNQVSYFDHSISNSKTCDYSSRFYSSTKFNGHIIAGGNFFYRKNANGQKVKATLAFIKENNSGLQANRNVVCKDDSINAFWNIENPLGIVKFIDDSTVIASKSGTISYNYDRSVYKPIQPTLTYLSPLGNKIYTPKSSIRFVPCNGELNILLYPNPFENLINIKTNETIISFELTTITGQVIYTSKGDKKEYNFGVINSGTYCAKIATNKTIYNVKLLKE